MGEAVDVGRLWVDDLEGLAEHLVEFMKPYRERVGWISREKHLDAFVAGVVGSSEGKSVEPIAYAQGVDRRQVQSVPRPARTTTPAPPLAAPLC
ncbi:MAG: hypothetical protein ACJ79R_10330 [Anaeromyxobacteraceae bacterium]